MSSCSGKERNRRRREALHKTQHGLCFYCQRPIGVHVGEQGLPVLEHHKPESLGGNRGNLVLACAWCDKCKGMMNGHEFKALIRDVCAGEPFALKHHPEVRRRSKSRNFFLQQAHQVRLTQRAPNGISGPCSSHAEITLAVANDSGNAGAANTRLGDAAENK